MPLFAKRIDNTAEINLSATRLLLASAFAVSSGVLLLWLLVRYWLFAP
jgi:hypothetical protein